MKFVYLIVLQFLVLHNLFSQCNNCATPIPVNAGLIACYPFNANSNDESGNANNGTPTGLSYAADRFGNAGRAGSFNGSTSKVNLPVSPFLLNTYSYCVWAKISAYPSSGSLFSALSIGSNTADQFISTANTPVSGTTGIGYSSYFSPVAPVPDRFASGTLPALNTWSFIVLTRSTDTLKFYINGVLVDARKTTTATAAYGSSAQTAVIGCRSGTAAQFFNGSLDDVRIYNRVISAGEVLQLYNLSSDTIIFNAGTDTTILAGDTAQLHATASSTLTYSWSPTTGLSNASISNPKANPAVTTQYILTVSNSTCSKKDTVIVYVAPRLGCTKCNSPISLNTGLVACYPFNANSNDESGNANNGTPTGLSYTADRYGNVGRAGSFNGSTSRVNLPVAPFLLNTYSYCVWAKMPAYPSSGNLFSTLSIGSNAADQFISIANTPVSGTTGLGYSSYFNPVGPIPDRFASGTLPVLNTWNFIVLTRSADTLKFYINGALVDTRKTTTTIAGYGSSGQTAVIGCRSGTAAQFFNGSLDDVRIYNRVISAGEVLQLYSLPADSIFVNAGNDTTIVAGDSAQLHTTATGAVSYTWTPATGLNNPSIANPKASPATSTKYVITVNNGSCSYSDTIMVFVGCNLTVSAGNDTTIIAGDSAQLHVTQNAGSTYSWSPTTGLNNTAIANPKASPAATTQYIVTVTKGSCSKTDTIIVNVTCNLTINAGNDTTIIAGDSAQLHVTQTAGSTYSWSPVIGLSSANIANPKASPAATTQYIVTVTRGSCTKTDTVAVNVTCNLTVNAGNDTTIIAGDSAQLHVTQTAGSTYSWSPVIGLSSANIANPKASPAATMQYIVTVTKGSCTKTDTVAVNVTCNLTVNAGNDTTIIAGDSAQLHVTQTAGSTYSWSPTSGLNNPNTTTPKASPAATTQYIVTVTKGSCTKTDTVIVNITCNLTVNAGNDTMIIAGDSAQLHVTQTAGSSYSWSPTTGLSNIGITNPKASPAATTQYIVTVTKGSCTKTDTVVVNVTCNLTVNAGNDTTIVAGDSAQLHVTQTAGSTYSWSPTTGLNNPSIANPKASPAATTQYIVTVTRGSCTKTDTVVVNVTCSLTVNAGNDTTICKGDSLLLKATAPGANRFKWNPGARFSSDTLLNPIVHPLPGNNVYVLYALNTSSGCYAYDTIKITTTSPVAQFTANPQDGIIPLQVQFSNQSTSGALIYNWDFGDSTISSSDTNPQHTYNNPGNHRAVLWVTDANGCKDSTSIAINTMKSASVFIPNVITPNNDLLNESFIVVYDPAAVASVKGTIWNRWGAEIYEFSMPGGSWWDGRSGGVDCPNGVYYYIVTVTDMSGKPQSMRGTVTLLR